MQIQRFDDEFPMRLWGLDVHAHTLFRDTYANSSDRRGLSPGEIKKKKKKGRFFPKIMGMTQFGELSLSARKRVRDTNFCLHVFVNDLLEQGI